MLGRGGPEFQSRNINMENLSRGERLRVLGVQAVCRGLDNRPADPNPADLGPDPVPQEPILPITDRGWDSEGNYHG